MIAALAFIPVLASPPVVVTFVVREDLPAVVEVARLARGVPGRAWRVDDMGRAEVHSGRLAIAGPPGVESVVLVRTTERPGYLLQGPFRWPAEPTVLFMERQWRRTVRGRGPSGGPLAWITPDPDSPRAICEWTLGDRWECLGVPRSTSGVVVRNAPSGLFYSVVVALGPRNDVEDVYTYSTSWGRLLAIQNVAESEGRKRDEGVRARALRRYRPPARPSTTRFEVMADTTIHIDTIARTAVWVTGSPDVHESWLELTMPGVGTARLDLSEVAGGSPDSVMYARLDPSMAISGRVSGPPATPLADTIVSLYRFGNQVSTANKKKFARERIAVAEGRTDADGSFGFRDLPPERYELLAIHSAYGRAARVVEPFESDVQLILKPPPVVKGTVVRRGVPQARLPVSFVPDLAAFAESDDPAELRGGEAETDADGRFSVFVAVSGAGELKVGSATGGVKRVPLPPADALPPLTELGEIELDAGPVLTIVFDESGDCQPILTGPVGRAGLAIVRAERLGPAMFSATLPEPGLWNVSALCGQRERPVTPAVLDVNPDMRDSTISLRWP